MCPCQLLVEVTILHFCISGEHAWKYGNDLIFYPYHCCSLLHRLTKTLSCLWMIQLWPNTFLHMETELHFSIFAKIKPLSQNKKWVYLKSSGRKWSYKTESKESDEEAHNREKETEDNEKMPKTSTPVKRQTKRSVEIGWIHKEDSEAKQVKAKQGGGTRKVVMDISDGYNEILKEWKNLFFPNGISSKGHESDTFDVWDFKQNPFTDHVSICNIRHCQTSQAAFLYCHSA